MLSPNFEELEEKKDFNEQCSGKLDKMPIAAETRRTNKFFIHSSCFS
ncbi:hypothetical protein bcgnr5372_63720 [Bacillus luti]